MAWLCANKVYLQNKQQAHPCRKLMEKLLPGENSQGFRVRQATSSGEGGEAKVLKKGGRQIRVARPKSNVAKKAGKAET